MKRYPGTAVFSRRRLVAAEREFYPTGWDRRQRTLGAPESRVRRALARVSSYRGPLLPNSYKESGTY
jgi:hypothetical protein